MSQHSPSDLTPEQLAVLIIGPYADGRFGAVTHVSIDQFRTEFIMLGKDIPQFREGMKFLLDQHILKRINDDELSLGSEGPEFFKMHYPGFELPK